MKAWPFFRWLGAGLLLIGLAAPLQAKPKKSQQDSLEKVIESVTGVDVSNAKPKKKGKKDHDNDRNRNWSGSPSRGNLEPLQAIREYIFGYRQSNGGRKGLPPGLAKKAARGGNLPPGWQKKVYPGAILPADLFGFASPLNASQVPRIQKPGPGVDLYSLGNQLIKLNRSDNRIVDVLDFD